MPDPFLSQLGGLCASERTAAKWVFVPSHAVGLTLGDRLAREGCDWANLRFATPLDVATRMAAPFLLERGIAPSEETLGPALVMRLLLNLPEAGGHFRPMAEHASMADALWRTIRELRYCGIRASDLEAKSFSSVPEKQRELVALLASYEQHLEAEHVADMPAVFAEAPRHLDWSPIAPDDLVLEFPDTIWPPLVRRFLDALPGRRVRPHALHTEGVTLPRRVAALAASAERVPPTSTTDAARLCSLLAPAPGGPPAHDGTLAIFHAGGRDAETGRGLPPHRVHRPSPRPGRDRVLASRCPHLWSGKRRRAWTGRSRSPPACPPRSTRPGRLLLRFCDWIESDFEAATLRRLLQSGDCRRRRRSMTDVSAGQAARLLLKAQATWGRETYAPSLTRLAEEYERRADGRRRRATRNASGARARPARRERSSRGCMSCSATSRSRTRAKRSRWRPSWTRPSAFLETFAGARRARLDAIGRIALVEALHELHGLWPLPLRPRHRLALPARARGLAHGRPRPAAPRPPARVHRFAMAGYDGRAPGLRRRPRGGRRLLRLPSRTRCCSTRSAQAISALLAHLRGPAGRGGGAGARRASAALGASCATICLSFSCRDTREFRETFPSWIVLQAFRLQQGDRRAHLRGPREAPSASRSPPVPANADRGLTDAAWWLAHRQAARAATGDPPRVSRARARAHGRPAARLGRLHRVRRLRARGGRRARPEPHAVAPSRPTTLENAAKCPLRFFMRHGLGVRPIEEGQGRRGRVAGAADPRARSCTRCSRASCGRCAREKRKPSLPTRPADGCASGAQQRLDELEAEMPPPPTRCSRAKRASSSTTSTPSSPPSARDVTARTPIGFEVPFGFPLAGGEEEPLASAEPLEIDIGDGRRLIVHGRIDRINQLGARRVRGGGLQEAATGPDDWQGEFAGGTRLQHALYGVAAARGCCRPRPEGARRPRHLPLSDRQRAPAAGR